MASPGPSPQPKVRALEPPESCGSSLNLDWLAKEGWGLA